MDKPVSNLDYVVYYAKKLKVNPRYFSSHKKFIDSQYKASQNLFRKRFGVGDEFKRNARKYLGIIN